MTSYRVDSRVLNLGDDDTWMTSVLRFGSHDETLGYKDSMPVDARFVYRIETDSNAPNMLWMADRLIPLCSRHFVNCELPNG